MESILSCPCLGETICGVDTDILLAYQTPKVVNIKDRALGLVKYFLMFIIFIYIVVIQIFFEGEHFDRLPVHGIHRMQWQQPTLNQCNPSGLECESDYSHIESLPYCSQYTGHNTSDVMKPCEYFDAMELPIKSHDGVLIPTYIKKFEQARACPPGSKECRLKFRYVDENGQLQNGRGEAVPISSVFVADVEDFSVMIDHAMSTRDGSLAYDDYNMQGYWQSCEKTGDNCRTLPITCSHSACESMGMFTAATGSGSSLLSTSHNLKPDDLTVDSGTSRPGLARGRILMQTSRRALQVEGVRELEPSTTAKAPMGVKEPVAIDVGDVFSLKTLLFMSGLSLDDVLPYKNEKNESRTIRLRGTALVVQIRYHNLEPWTLFKAKDPPSYTVSVTNRPVRKFKQSYVASQTDTNRQVESAYGVKIILEQSGEVAKFHLVHGLVVLTAALGLMAAANTLTDMIALHCMSKSQEYKELKYQQSKDMSEI